MEATMKVPLMQRINFRLIIFFAVMGGVIGYPIYLFLDEAMTGGIHDYGSYKEVNLQAMSTFTFDQINGTVDQIPEKWRQLDGKKIVTEGEMWAGAGNAAAELNRFDLVYSKTKCCFNGPPLVQHFVKATVVGGKVVPYYDTRVKVTGILHVKVVKDPSGAGVLSCYSLDVQDVQEL